VRRRAAQAPLTSAFAAVLEPYEGKPRLGAVRRLEFRDTAGNLCADGFVAIEIPRADGGRDLFMSADVETAGHAASVTEAAGGAEFTGDLCLVRFDASKRPVRALFCRGRSLRAGELTIRAKDEQASFEVDLERPDAPVVGGPAEAVEAVELGGVRLWPK
jgi:hypothetical protein